MTTAAGMTMSVVNRASRTTASATSPNTKAPKNAIQPIERDVSPSRARCTLKIVDIGSSWSVWDGRASADGRGPPAVVADPHPLPRPSADQSGAVDRSEAVVCYSRDAEDLGGPASCDLEELLGATGADQELRGL